MEADQYLLSVILSNIRWKEATAATIASVSVPACDVQFRETKNNLNNVLKILINP